MSDHQNTVLRINLEEFSSGPQPGQELFKALPLGRFIGIIQLTVTLFLWRRLSGKVHPYRVLVSATRGSLWISMVPSLKRGLPMEIEANDDEWLRTGYLAHLLGRMTALSASRGPCGAFFSASKAGDTAWFHLITFLSKLRPAHPYSIPVLCCWWDGHTFRNSPTTKWAAVIN